jgi:hypothetical protein
MIEGRPFLYQDRNGTVYNVNKEGAQAIESWNKSEHIVAFVDGDNEGDVPADMLLKNPNVQLMLASSPQGTRGKWLKDAGDVDILATELWSPRELFIAGSVIGLLISTLD